MLEKRHHLFHKIITFADRSYDTESVFLLFLEQHYVTGCGNPIEHKSV